MHVEVKPGVEEREAYMKGEGFVLFTDAGQQLLEHLADQPVPYLCPKEQEDYFCLYGDKEGLNKSNIALFGVLKLLAQEIPDRYKTSTYDRTAFFGLEPKEGYWAKKHTYDYGVDDMDFTWYFSGALANIAVQSFVEKGKINEEDATNLTVGDWANLINSKWFASLHQSLAFTGFGVYTNTGLSPFDYRKDEFEDRIRKTVYKDYALEPPEADLLALEDDVDHIEGTRQLTATVSPKWHATLRYIRQKSRHSAPTVANGKSIGCPVARRHTILPEDYRETMPRAVHLGELGILSFSDVGDGKVLATQENTVIDRTLQFIAAQLRAYDEKHGTPQFFDPPKKNRHKKLPPTGVLVKPIS